MSEAVVKVNNISKYYRLGKPQGDTFKEAVSLWLGRLLRKHKPVVPKDLWALKDISFEMKKGEALGIVGRNGAGKSTLLKILAEITHPTEGFIETNGKVAAVLEIGMGFHPELSGAENIFLSASIMGMSQNEIRSVYDEIVKFSDLEKFIDTPVKNYSSGMYMRLAFAVIAHIKADIFLFDEVLSVGDAAFRFKCQKKINELVNSGKTIILVSHNLNDVANICPKSLLLEDGKVKAYGHTFGILNDYMEASISQSLNTEESPAYPEDQKFYDEDKTSENIWQKESPEPAPAHKLPAPFIDWSAREDAPANDFFMLKSIEVKPLGLEAGKPITTDTPIEVCVTYFKKTNDCFIDVGFGVVDKSGILVFISNTKEIEFPDTYKTTGVYQAKTTIPKNLLNSSIYSLSLFVAKDKFENIMNLAYVLSFKIELSEVELKSEWLKHYPPDPGILKPKLKWEVKQI